jgi:hypothetical protein
MIILITNIILFSLFGFFMLGFMDLTAYRQSVVIRMAVKLGYPDSPKTNMLEAWNFAGIIHEFQFLQRCHSDQEAQKAAVGLRRRLIVVVTLFALFMSLVIAEVSLSPSLSTQNRSKAEPMDANLPVAPQPPSNATH